MKTVCIFGQLASAKDTVANRLVEKLNEKAENKWKRIGFADSLKHVFMNSFDVTWDFIEEWKRKDEMPPGFTLNVRKSLQQIGDGFRQIQPDVWIRTALRNNHNMVISDGRYINEAKMVKEKKGINILLWRPGHENNDPNPSESQIKPYVNFAAQNCKEGRISFGIEKCVEEKDVTFTTNMLNFDYFLKNDGTIDDLYAKIDNQLIPFIEKRLK